MAHFPYINKKGPCAGVRNGHHDRDAGGVEYHNGYIVSTAKVRRKTDTASKSPGKNRKYAVEHKKRLPHPPSPPCSPPSAAHPSSPFRPFLRPFATPEALFFALSPFSTPFSSPFSSPFRHSRRTFLRPFATAAPVAAASPAATHRSPSRRAPLLPEQNTAPSATIAAHFRNETFHFRNETFHFFPFLVTLDRNIRTFVTTFQTFVTKTCTQIATFCTHRSQRVRKSRFFAHIRCQLTALTRPTDRAHRHR